MFKRSSNVPTNRSNAVLLLCSFLSFVFRVCLCHTVFSVLAPLWSPAGKGLTFWLSWMWYFFCVFVTFPYGALGQMWYLFVSISDFCRLSFFVVGTCFVIQH